MLQAIAALAEGNDAEVAESCGEVGFRAALHEGFFL